jgi:hypothetical protein
VLFAYTTQLNSTYYIVSSPDSYGSTTINIADYTVNVFNSSETVFILALRGFYGFTAVNNLTFGWQNSSVASDTTLLQINKTNIQAVYYSFFQIAKYTNPAASNGTGIPNSTNSTTNGTNSTNTTNATNSTNSTNSTKTNTTNGTNTTITNTTSP